MDQLLKYLETLEDQLECQAEKASLICSHLQLLKDQLNETRTYYQGFGGKEDKKKIRCFEGEMTDEEFDDFWDNYTAKMPCRFLNLIKNNITRD